MSSTKVTEIVHHPLRMRMLEVIELSRPTPRLVRVALAGAEIAGLRSDGASDHVKVFAPSPGEHTPRVPELGEHGIVPPPPGSPRPIGRDYTPRHHRLHEGVLELDIVLHAGGHMSGWATRADIGDRLGVAGPRGSRVLRVVPSHLVLAADETGLAAVHNFLLAARSGQRVTVVADVADRDEIQPLESDARLDVRWSTRDRAGGGDGAGTLAEAVAALDRPTHPDTFCWAAAEASVVDGVRTVYRDTWGVDPAWIDARGYWRRGVADHQEPHDD